ncbi:GON-4-like protein [Electrophorus electricus]|uniref:GON-4-like protein n=1 Tax=Electrophorus electricus TaxID=8005 RepID=UPI0015D01602|nr:GON-4-like protein [Electrophorus electricus]
MKTGRKRKSSSPEPRPEHAKVLKRDAVSGYLGTCRLTLSPSKRISTPTKNKSQNSLSPRKHSRFKNHCDKPGFADGVNGEVQSSSSAMSSPFQSEEDTELGLVITLDEERGEEQERVRRRSGGKPKKAVVANDNDDCPMADSERPGGDSAPEDDSEEEEFTKLDRDLTIKSRQHNLTSVDVRKIIHEVITNEHVVAMMKAAIKDTQDMPMFEPKMTRSKLKEVVERGVGIPTWNISPIKKSKEIKPPQFLDIPLEDEEDSSDEEYHPDEDEEDETAEETILESDLDSTASSPRISRRGHSRTPVDLSECEEDRNSVTQLSRTSRHLRVEAVPMGPPAPPSQTCGSSRPQRALDSFMEKLHAVDEELELSPLCMEPYQTLSSSENAEESLVACRTRSKRPLRDVPLDQLEAKLRAPDITPDMYDCISALEDREWSQWLQGLMTSQLDNEEEGDDDDDPEYNFLEDLDEPDLEDYRNDRAVRITKKEVNELMEELFETFQDELGMNEHDEEGHEEEEERDEEAASQNIAKFNVPQAIRFEEPLAHMLTACRRTVREQLDALQQRREPQSRMSPITLGPTVVILPSPCSLVLSTSQKRRLQQQIQQHIQLLTQVNMLCSPVEALHSQASTTKLFLVELKLFAERAEQLRVGVVSEFRSVFRVYNLQASLDLLEELEQMPPPPTPSAKRSHPVHPYPLLPAHLAWLFATRSVFLYPELLPHCSLDPALQPPRSKHFYTKGEDGLIVLGLKHFSETEFPYHLMSQHLLQPKKREQLRVRVKDMCSSRAADNVIKFYCQHRVVPALPVACCQVLPGEERPPVEREKNIMPNWLRKSLPHIHKAVFENQSEVRPPYDTRTSPTSPTFIFPEKTQYPPSLPKGLTLLLHPSSRRQNSVQPPKPRPLRGFSCPVLTPLAKASPGPTGIVNVLPKVQAPLSSQRVILLTQVDATPAHGTVPLSSVGPINFQYVVPQLGSVNPAQPPVSLPPDVVQVPPAPAVPSDGLVTTCVMQAPQKKAGVSKKPVMPKKLLPIQPLPLNPAPQLSQLIPLIPGPTVNVNLANTGPAMDQVTAASFAKNISNAASSVVIIQPASPFLDATGVPPHGLVKASTAPPPQLSITQPISSLPHLGTLARPLLLGNNVGISSHDVPKEPEETEFKLKSSPVFFSHTPSPPLQATVKLKSILATPTVKQKEHSWQGEMRTELVCNLPVANYQTTPSLNTLSNGLSIVNVNSRSLLPGNSSTGSAQCAMNPQTPSSLIDSPADDSHCVLVQAALPGGTPQLLVPQNSLIPEQPLLQQVGATSGAPQHQTALTKPETFHRSNMSNMREGALSSRGVGLSSEGAVSRVTAQLNLHGLGGEVCIEEVESGAEMAGEEMAGALFASPLLMLSESSRSSSSSLSSSLTDSTEALDSVLEDSMENLAPAEQRGGWEESRRLAGKDEEKTGSGGTSAGVRAGQTSSRGEGRELPGLLTLASGAKSQEPTAGGEGQTEGNGEDREDREGGGGHQNGENGGGGEREGNGAYRREDGEGGGERDGPGRRQGNEGRDKNDEEKDGDGEREEEEEDFDELTQDEDEEEVMSSASEESVLSVPELQETMEKLTWLASERRLCGEGDSEEENSPNSPTSPTSPTSPISQNSQEDNSEDEEDGAMKGEELEPTEGEGGKLPEGEAPPEDDPPQTSGKGTGRGRGRGRPPPRSLRRSRRQDRGSKDASKLLLLYDDHILDNDPLRESKDIAFAQAYLNRVREAMLDAPGKMEEFLSLLYEFEQGGENRSAVELFSQLRPLLKDWPELLRDFAAFLLPEQALECGLFEEQQAFERSRRFLRQLEISFGENPSHYQKIVRALQAGSALTPTGVEELKAQMATLLKGHTHLQGEFSLFFDEMRPPLARPGQFEEALWPEDGGGGPEGGDGGMNLASAGGVSAGFEEVALPDLEEEEETQKIAQITGRSRRRKELNTHRNYKQDCGWPEKDCLCPCHDCSNDAKHRRHRRKGCPHCHGNKGTDGTKAPKSGDSTFTMSEPLPERGEEREESERGGEDGGEEKETGVKDETGSRASSPHHEAERPTWESNEGDALNPEEKDDEEDEEEGERDHSSSPSGDKVGLVAEGTDFSPLPQSGGREAAQQIRQSPSSDTHVCAKNISLTPSGERVVLWTREADRVILTACQQQGANQDTFQDVSAQLGNKTASEVSKRFRDLMRLFHTSARQASSEDEAIEQQSATDEEQD